jgi:predicted enzyme related to lactoylglutathione lyase
MTTAAIHPWRAARERAWSSGMALLLLLAYASPALVIAFIAGCVSTEDVDTSASGISFSEKPLYGKVVWNDLMTEDLDAARRFYGGVFGWTFDNYSARAGRGRYAIARLGNVYVAGLVPVSSRADGKKISRWLPYVSVDNVERAVQRATKAGATVAVDVREVGFGRVAAIIDPEGAVIGLARSKIGDPDDATTRARVGRIVWTELLTNRAPTEAAEFYRSLADYDVKTIERRGGQYTLLTMQGENRAGILKNPSSELQPVWLTYFGVDDPVEASAKVESFGGKVLLPPSPNLREGTMAVVADPSGAILILQKFPIQES